MFEPFDVTLKRDFGYYLTYPPERRDVRQIMVFRDWLASRFEEHIT